MNCRRPRPSWYRERDSHRPTRTNIRERETSVLSNEEMEDVDNGNGYRVDFSSKPVEMEDADNGDEYHLEFPCNPNL